MSDTIEDQPPGDEPSDAAAPDAGASSEGDPVAGWSTLKVVGLVAAAAFMAVLVALAVQSRVDGPAEDSVDVGFLRDMIDHHDQAVQIGLIGVANAGDAEIRSFAQDAVVAQRWELGYMEALLEDWGYQRGDLDRDVMSWMGMSVPLEDMPGLASEEEMAAFRDMEGTDADSEFIELMTEHHRGGVHMAEAAAADAGDERVRALAERMARIQSAEIAEYANRARQLGLDT